MTATSGTKRKRRTPFGYGVAVSVCPQQRTSLPPHASPVFCSVRRFATSRETRLHALGQCASSIVRNIMLCGGEYLDSSDTACDGASDRSCKALCVKLEVCLWHAPPQSTRLEYLAYECTCTGWYLRVCSRHPTWRLVPHSHCSKVSSYEHRLYQQHVRCVSILDCKKIGQTMFRSRTVYSQRKEPQSTTCGFDEPYDQTRGTAAHNRGASYGQIW